MKILTLSFAIIALCSLNLDASVKEQQASISINDLALPGSTQIKDSDMGIDLETLKQEQPYEYPQYFSIQDIVPLETEVSSGSNKHKALYNALRKIPIIGKGSETQVKYIMKGLNLAKSYRHKVNKGLSKIKYELKKTGTLTQETVDKFLPGARVFAVDALGSAASAIKPTLKNAGAGVSLGGSAGGAIGVLVGLLGPGFGNLIGAGVGVAGGAVLGGLVAGGTTFVLYFTKDFMKTHKKSEKPEKA